MTSSETIQLAVPKKRFFDTRAVTGVAMVTAAAAAFGLLGLLAREARDGGANVGTTLALRYTLGAVVLVVVAQFVLRRDPTAVRRFTRADVGSLMLLGVFAISQSVLYFNALIRMPISTATLISWVYPVFVVALTVGLRHEGLTNEKALALLVSLLGVGLVAGGLSGFEVLGATLTVAASVVYAGYVVIGSRVLSRAHPLLASTIVIVSAAVLLWVGSLFAWEVQFPDRTGGWLAVLGLGLLCTAFPTVALFGGLRLVGASWGAITSTAEPVVAVFLAYIVYSERLTTVQIMGAALILVGGIILPLFAQARAAPVEPASDSLPAKI